LGEQLVIAFWGAGWNVALVGRNQAALERVVLRLEEKPNQSTAIFSCDLGNQDQVANLVDQILLKLPSLKVLINNAAIHGPIGPFSSCDMKLWAKTIQVNFFAPVFLCHGLIDLIIKSGGGSIINISGGGATSPRPGFSAYASGKTSLVRFSETLAQELETSNIRVNCIAPGAMKTTLLEEVCRAGVNLAGKREFFLASKALSEVENSIDKVSELALFLANETSKGVTGKLISALWDRWQVWPEHLIELQSSDIYTLRRITGRDRGMDWGDI
jgi:3-oxoacyl-[acyl-carrier protein] reductase